ncbi:phosphotransferase family protein [Salinibacillus xinjiangensis]|uniref:Phosphotransferase n=1 Tax=Salinibacillus xinjiangensis TaxID=1229268 RepID=A0A6G1X1M3_9BACI|nr:phosphotransferase family protein [Salinibacillus xinjiangensis]MRG84891.1 phosphotransferase [Salinibacillus xinjiangensis]
MNKYIQVRDGEELDREIIKAFILSNFENVKDDKFEVKQFPSGKSNLTYFIKMGEWEGVLRRPPNGPLPPKAHDMNREHDLLKKLHTVFPLAPKPYILCNDKSVLNCPFYIMERIKGHTIDDELIIQKNMTKEQKRHISTLMVDAIVELHNVDYKQVGLEKLGFPKGFLERRLNNWISRFNKYKTEDIGVLDNVTKWLKNNIPKEQKATLIHNDFKLNNALVDDSLKHLNGIVDWEMTTIGDPLFDLGSTLSYWVEEDDSELLKESLEITTAQPGFITREEFLQMYVSKTGRDISSFLFYLVLAYFKIAVTQQQIYYRYKSGTTNDPRFARFKQSVRNLIIYSDRLIQNKRI